jgi:hypothetical protein
MRLLVIALLLGSIASCGGGRSSSSAPSPQRDRTAPPTDTAPTSVDAAPAESSGDAGTGDAEEPGTACASWCTLIAVCWEEVNDAEYNHGGICTVECTDKTEGDRRAFGRCVTSHTDDCPAMLSC